MFCARACDVGRAPPGLAVNGMNLGSRTSEILSCISPGSKGFCSVRPIEPEIETDSLLSDARPAFGNPAPARDAVSMLEGILLGPWPAAIWRLRPAAAA